MSQINKSDDATAAKRKELSDLLYRIRDGDDSLIDKVMLELNARVLATDIRKMRNDKTR